MKSKAKDTNVDIQPTMLNQIHFPVCMYTTMWAAKKEEHIWMIGAKFDNFCRLNWNTIDLPTIKEIIYGFWVHNAASVLWGKQIFLNSFDINHIFKLPIEGIVVPMQEVYNEEWLKYFEGGKEKHYK